MHAFARLPLLIALAAAAVTAAACGSDSTTSPTGTTTTTASIYNVYFDSNTVDSASIVAGTPVTVHVHVTAAGKAVSGAPVTWSVTTGHGHVSATTTTSDSLGAASVVWVVGDTVRVDTLTVVSLDATSRLRAAVIAGKASALLKTTPDSSGTVSGSSLPITVRVVDSHGNAVKGTVVTWTTTRGTLSTASATSGASGDAQTVLTTSGATGTYLVTATLAGLASVTFRVVGL